MDSKKCAVSDKCGGCKYTALPYKRQLENKQKYIEKLLGKFAPVRPIIGMKDPFYYRNKVHHAFTKDRSGNIISGPYEEGSHWIIDTRSCLIEDRQCFDIAKSVGEVAKKLRVPIYNEKNGTGVLRRVLVRKGFKSSEIMAVLVVGSPKFIKKKEFAKELVKIHPEITTVISNLNDKRTSMILGDKEEVLYGPGYITDELCGLTFRISSKSFYQVNPVQTEVLYRTAMEFAGFKGNESIIDAYCGIGTITLAAAKAQKEKGNVKAVGIELNSDAIKDARINAKANGFENVRFITGDAGEHMKKMAASGEKADIIFMDPPRSGSTISFMKAAVKMEPEKIIYISCGPESLARNLEFFKENGYEAQKIQPVDMFPHTDHVETVVLMAKVN